MHRTAGEHIDAWLLSLSGIGRSSDRQLDCRQSSAGRD
jgi:hypothetical protein